MRVLIAYDGSAGAAMAVRLAEKIDWSAGSMVRVVSVMEPAAIPVRPATLGIDSTRHWKRTCVPTSRLNKPRSLAAFRFPAARWTRSCSGIARRAHWSTRRASTRPIC